MSDDEAYMALLLTNTQSELHPLEEGLHALRSGMTIRKYAARAGRSEQSINRAVWAAKVVNHMVDDWSGFYHGTPEQQRAAIEMLYATDEHSRWRHLAEIHPAPQWLWLALAQHLLWETWTVEETRRQVTRVQQLATPLGAALLHAPAAARRSCGAGAQRSDARSRASAQGLQALTMGLIGVTKRRRMRGEKCERRAGL
jgi:hypothetical protein